MSPFHSGLSAWRGVAQRGGVSELIKGSLEPFSFADRGVARGGSGVPGSDELINGSREPFSFADLGVARGGLGVQGAMR